MFPGIRHANIPTRVANCVQRDATIIAMPTWLTNIFTRSEKELLPVNRYDGFKEMAQSFSPTVAAPRKNKYRK
jgi:hypothetical protein